jgi:hypothetical protein
MLHITHQAETLVGGPRWGFIQTICFGQRFGERQRLSIFLILGRRVEADPSTLSTHPIAKIKVSISF